MAVVTLTDWRLGLMIAATEIPAQLLLLLFGVFFKTKNNKLVLKKMLKVV